MKHTILGILIAILLIPQTSFAMTLEQRAQILSLIEVLMHRIIELQDQLLQLREAELAEKKAEFESLKTTQSSSNMATEKTYRVTSPSDGKVHVDEKMTKEEMREFIISLNRDHIKFRQRMEVAPVEELVEFLKANGYTVK